jgi:hypothetical protein
MAKRRKTRRVRRFGSSAAIHKAKAGRDMNYARISLQVMREKLRAGDCKNAIGWLAWARQEYGASRANEAGYRRRTNTRPSNPLRALNSAERRVIDRCVKARPD